MTTSIILLVIAVSLAVALTYTIKVNKKLRSDAKYYYNRSEEMERAFSSSDIKRINIQSELDQYKQHKDVNKKHLDQIQTEIANERRKREQAEAKFFESVEANKTAWLKLQEVEGWAKQYEAK